MFKNLTLYRYVTTGDAPFQPEAFPFTPCGPTQQKSIGFVPPRGHEHGLLAEVVAGQAIMKVRLEKRTVPGATLRKRVDEMAAQIQDQTGRKPGAKRRRELREEALLDLLPQAFTRETGVWVWISPIEGAPNERLLAIDSASASVNDDILTLFTKAAPGMVIASLITQKAPAPWMANLLLGGDDADESTFAVGREAALVQPDSQGAAVRFVKHALHSDAVRVHLVGGKTVKALGLTHMDTVHFVLDDAMRLRKIEIEDVAPVSNDASEDPFDTNVTLATGFLSKAIKCLVHDLGGMAEFPMPMKGAAA